MPSAGFQEPQEKRRVLFVCGGLGIERFVCVLPRCGNQYQFIPYVGIQRGVGLVVQGGKPFGAAGRRVKALPEALLDYNSGLSCFHRRLFLILARINNSEHDVKNNRRLTNLGEGCG